MFRVIWGHDLELAARALLEVADREPGPVWPSDESVRAYYAAIKHPGYEPGNSCFEACRAGVRHAMLHDPIIRAAVEYVTNASAGDVLVRRWSGLRDAVKASGLTPEDLP